RRALETGRGGRRRPVHRGGETLRQRFGPGASAELRAERSAGPEGGIHRRRNAVGGGGPPGTTRTGSAGGASAVGLLPNGGYGRPLSADGNSFLRAGAATAPGVYQGDKGQIGPASRGQPFPFD